MSYTTVFDLVGKFHEVIRAKEGDPNPKHKNKDVVLARGITCQQAAMGRAVHEVAAKKLAKPHFLMAGLVRRWMYDFQLIERRVYDKPEEMKQVA